MFPVLPVNGLPFPVSVFLLPIHTEFLMCSLGSWCAFDKLIQSFIFCFVFLLS